MDLVGFMTSTTSLAPLEISLKGSDLVAEVAAVAVGGPDVEERHWKRRSSLICLKRRQVVSASLRLLAEKSAIHVLVPEHDPEVKRRRVQRVAVTDRSCSRRVSFEFRRRARRAAAKVNSDGPLR